MTTNDRREILFEKRLCAQCLEPGVKFDEEHECSKEYGCPDKFHRKFKIGLHVLTSQRKPRKPKFGGKI